MSDMPNLQPCPFCGKGVTLRTAIPGYDDAFVYCDNCNIEGTRCVTDQEAVKFWNTRLDAPEVVALVEALKIATDDLEEWVGCKTSLEAAGFNMDDTAERANTARAALEAWEALK